MSEFISVKDERKPNDRQECLVFVKMCYAKYYKIATYSENLASVDEYELRERNHPGFYDYDSEWGFYEVTGVTHWMSLPDEPKEE